MDPNLNGDGADATQSEDLAANSQQSELGRGVSPGWRHAALHRAPPPDRGRDAPPSAPSGARLRVDARQVRGPARPLRGTLEGARRALELRPRQPGDRGPQRVVSGRAAAAA